MNITEFIKKTDFEKLRKQKTALLTIINYGAATGSSKEQKEKLEGLLIFLDNFQDMVVDEYGECEEKVFGNLE